MRVVDNGHYGLGTCCAAPPHVLPLVGSLVEASVTSILSAMNFRASTNQRAVVVNCSTQSLKPGRCGTMTHDYKRNGTTTLFAALDVLDGKVIGRCMQRHRHQEFIRFLNAIEAEVPVGKIIHVILDNYCQRRWKTRPSGGGLGASSAQFFCQITASLFGQGRTASSSRPAVFSRRAQRRSRRPDGPRVAARSVLDGREHDGTLAAGGRARSRRRWVIAPAHPAHFVAGAWRGASPVLLSCLSGT